MHIKNLGEDSILTTIPVYEKNLALGNKVQYKSNKLYLEYEDCASLNEGEKVLRF